MTARSFIAVAMPHGDPSRGMLKPGVLLTVREAGEVVDFFVLERGEAEALRGQLARAEDALLAGERFNRERMRA